MVSLEMVKPTIQKILTEISVVCHTDAAVIDEHCNLVVSTQPYLKYKGQNVHAPSVQEVLCMGSVLVNKPGYMKSCIGCRFNEHCPSTIEILNCIKIHDHPLGVIALTSFTKEGKKRLEQHMNTYMEILNEASNLITDVIMQSERNSELYSLSKMLKAAMDLSHHGFLMVNGSGTISHLNPSARKVLPFKLLESQPLQQILPQDIVSEIISGNALSNKRISTSTYDISISSYSVKSDNKFNGAIICLDNMSHFKKEKKAASSSASKFSNDEIIGTSKAILDIKSKIPRIANSSSTVLVTGETGTGKELVAKAIHYVGSRSRAPFISINCASIPESIFESELFGYEEGAFTGAKKGGKPGIFELANGGTLFLDEIGDMPLAIQPKLLRVLQDKAVQRVGGTYPISVDVRIIAATNQNLEELVLQKKFRSDLYYRLNVIPLNLPPLRQRKEDIASLCSHFLGKYCFRLNKQIKGFSKEVINMLLAYNWPGNIRELENLVEYTVNMECCDIISIQSLPDTFKKYGGKLNFKLKEDIKSIEASSIKAALDRYGWDLNGKKQAARELGIGLRTLYRKLEKLNN